MYRRAELEKAVKDLAKNVYCQYSGDPDIESVDIRLCLDGSGGFELKTGDSQYDADHKGYWGSSEVITHAERDEEWGDLDPNDYDSIADGVVGEAMDNLFTNSNWRHIDDAWGDKERRSYELGDDYTLITDSQDIEACLDAICVIDPEYSLGSIFALIGNGDYVEVWASEKSIPYSNTIYSEIKLN